MKTIHKEIGGLDSAESIKRGYFFLCGSMIRWGFFKWVYLLMDADTITAHGILLVDPLGIDKHFSTNNRHKNVILLA